MPPSDEGIWLCLLGLFILEVVTLRSLEFASSSVKASARCQLLGGRRWSGEVRDGAERESSESSWSDLLLL